MRYQCLNNREQKRGADSNLVSSKHSHNDKLNVQCVGVPFYLQRTHSMQRQAEPEEEEEEYIPATGETGSDFAPVVESFSTGDAGAMDDENTFQTRSISPLIQNYSEPEQVEEEVELSQQAEGEKGNARGIKRVARDGVAGPGGTYPHLKEIQQSFGMHDVTGVRAHIGGVAKVASERIGAEAYALGDQVAFRSAPDLHSAAHEAAHVVQQRQGVQLNEGVGEVGDQYELNADEVAGQVVRGQSAEHLLTESHTADDFRKEKSKVVSGAEEEGNTSLTVQMRKPRFVSDMVLGPHKGASEKVITAACKKAKRLVFGLYRKYGQQPKQGGIFDTSARNFQKQFYNFRWRESLRDVARKIITGKWYFLSTKNLLLRLWSGLKGYEKRVKHTWKNIGGRSALGREKERRLRQNYGYIFQYLRDNSAGNGRCTILSPKREVLYYRISSVEMELVLPKLYRYARDNLAIKAAKKSRPPFSYATCFSEAKNEYRNMGIFDKVVADRTFPNILAFAACLEREWGSGCPSLGPWAPKIISSVNGSHGKGLKNWELVKGVYHRYKLLVGAKLFNRLALSYATSGKWDRFGR